MSDLSAAQQALQHLPQNVWDPKWIETEEGEEQ